MGKIGAKPKSRANARAGRKSAGENDGNANVLAEVREIIREMQQVEPDVTAGWCANLDSIASGIAGAGVAEWLGGDAGAAHATLLSVVVDMGSRAPDGRNALWRNWTRTFAIRALKKLGLETGMPKELTTLESLETPEPLSRNPAAKLFTQPPDLHTIFTTPDRMQEEMRERRSEEMLKEMARRQEEMMAVNAETARAVLKLSGRVGDLERDPKAERTQTAAPSGLDQLERRLSEYKGVFEPARRSGANDAGGNVGAAGVAPASSEPSQGKPKADEENKQNTALSVTYRRLQHLSQNPLNVLMPLAEGFRPEMPAWPFAGTAAGDRVAPQYLAGVYRSGRRGVEYAEGWLRDHGPTKNHMAQNMKHNLHAIDEMLMYDGVDVINSAGVEILARRCYALELVFEDCKTDQDWRAKDPKNLKSKLQIFEKYDVTAMMKNGLRVPEADATVKKQLELEAQYAKYLAKAPKAQEDAA